MRSLLFVMTAVAVMALAFWAYRENYRTQETISDVRNLHAQIGAAHARLGVLRAEWAYLNRPDRLRDLADLNFDRLGLLPIMPEAFGQVENVAYPGMPLLPLTNSVTLSSDGSIIDTEEPL